LFLNFFIQSNRKDEETKEQKVPEEQDKTTKRVTKSVPPKKVGNIADSAAYKKNY